MTSDFCSSLILRREHLRALLDDNALRTDDLHQTRLQQSIDDPADLEIVHLVGLRDLLHRVSRIDERDHPPLLHAQVHILERTVCELQRHFQAGDLILRVVPIPATGANLR
ncbi:MAG: hypothetical protein MZV64_19695 [Ignavibacteriales bacterium]|nr:hypothetical protein [Ignavibacteriales bacterium]